MNRSRGCRGCIAALSACLVLTGSVPATGAIPGDFDITFGGGDGRVTLHASESSAQIIATEIGPDGSLLTVGTIDEGVGGVLVTRTSALGVPDASFGTGGAVVVPNASVNETVAAVDVAGLSDGRVAVLRHRSVADYNSPENRSLLTLLTATGGIDTSFGVAGTAVVQRNDSSGTALGPSGDVAVAGTGDATALLVTAGPPPANGSMRVVRYPVSNGVRDLTYGVDGEVSMPVAYDYWRPVRLVGTADGSLLWTSQTTDIGSEGQGLTIGRLTSLGAPDSGFGTAGVLAIPATASSSGNRDDRPLRIQLRAGGGVDVLAVRETGSLRAPVAVRVSAAGGLDASYSGDGVAELPTTANLAVQDGGVVDDRARFISVLPTGQVRLAGLTEQGTPDLGLGPGGVRPSAYTVPVTMPTPTRGFVLADTVVVATARSAVPGNDPELVALTTVGPRAPDAPIAVTAIAGARSAQVSWTAPADGGSPITSYTVTSDWAPTRSCTAIAPSTTCVVAPLVDGTPYSFTVRATNAAGTSSPSAATPALQPFAGFTNVFPPRRLADSRSPSGQTDDHLYQGFGAVAASVPVSIKVAGRPNVPAGTANVGLNVTAVNPAANGYLTVYPCGTVPSTSTLNFTKGVTIANHAISKLSASGNVCVVASAKTDLIIDISGYYADAALTSLPTPRRIADSRSPGGHTDDGQAQAFGRLAAGTTRTIQVAGRVGLPADASSAVIDVVAVNPSGPGYLTVHSCGTLPSTSSMNVTSGRTIASTVVTRLSLTGTLCVFTAVATDLIIDVSGTLASTSFTPLTAPKRIADSRYPGGHTDDGQAQRFGRLAAGTSRMIPIAGRVGLPGVDQFVVTPRVVLTVVAVNPSASGYLMIYSCGARPATSDLNYTKGVTIANTVTARPNATLDLGYPICVYTSAATDLIVDVAGSLR